jgi:SanA protein
MICNYLIIRKSSPFIYSRIELVPYNKAGLLLGTSKNFRGGAPNLYFDNRINAAVSLYRAKRIKYLIVSGDNRKASYNEPVMMKKELIRLGVPDMSIILDYAGFRTFDSVIRCREIFSQNSITIISQRFHLERAIYISHYFGIGAIGYEAKDVGWSSGFKTKIRENFARVKVFWDIHTGEKPKFLGKKITIK